MTSAVRNATAAVLPPHSSDRISTAERGSMNRYIVGTSTK
jgi:hypothetical protein